MAVLSQADLQKQTVAQLTALCQEHKLSGYSKLKKAALVETLETHRDRFKATVSVTAISVQPNVIDPAERNVQPDSGVVLGDAVDGAPSGSTVQVQSVLSKVVPRIVHKETSAHPKNTSKPLISSSLSKTVPTVDSTALAATPLSSISNLSLPPPPRALQTKSNVPLTTLPMKRSIDHLPISLPRTPKKRLLNPVTDDHANKELSSTLKQHATPVRGAQTVLPPSEPWTILRNALLGDLLVVLKAKQPPSIKNMPPSLLLLRH